MLKVVTDQNALKALVNKAILEGRLACWQIFLLVLALKSFNVVV